MVILLRDPIRKWDSGSGHSRGSRDREEKTLAASALHLKPGSGYQAKIGRNNNFMPKGRPQMKDQNQKNLVYPETDALITR